MRRNRGWSCVPGRVVDDLMSRAAARLAASHPSVGTPVVAEVVYQAAVELVSTVTDPEQLGRLLERRANARLMAMMGAPIALVSRTAPRR